MPARRRGDVYSTPARCGRLAGGLKACDGQLTLRLRGAGHPPITLGQRHFAIAPQTLASVRVQIRRAGRRALRGLRQPVLDVEVTVLTSPRTGKSSSGADITPRLTGRWTVRLP